MKNKFKAVIFDLDGTLSDSGAGIVRSLKYAFDKMDMRIPPEAELQAHIGSSLKAIFVEAYGVPEGRLADAIRLYREYYIPKGMYENTLFPGIVEMLSSLTSKGLPLAVATAKPEPYAEQIVAFLKLREYFVTVAGSTLEETRITKEEIIGCVLERTGLSAADCLMVGDRNHDMHGAKAHGMKSAAVLWGYGNEAEFTESGADFLVKTPMDLVELV